MKGSQLAVAGGVFVAVLVVCFALIGFGAKGEATAKPDPVAVVPPVNPAPPEPTLAAPTPPAAALGGFGLVARLERGYDGTVGLTRSGSGEKGRTTTVPQPTGSSQDPAPDTKKPATGLTDS